MARVTPERKLPVKLRCVFSSLLSLVGRSARLKPESARFDPGRRDPRRREMQALSFWCVNAVGIALSLSMRGNGFDSRTHRLNGYRDPSL